MIPAYAKAKDDSPRGLTKNKMYPILKITYPKLNPEGLVTIINDDHTLLRATAYLFTFWERKEI